MRDVDEDVVDLRDYLDVLRRQLWMIVGTIILVVAIAVVWSVRQTAMHEARTLLVVEPPASAGQVEQLLYGSTDLQTQVEIITSRPVVERALETAAAGLDASSPRDVAKFIDHHLDVSAVDNTTVMEVVVTAEDPEAAATLSRAVAEAYLTYLREDAEARSREAIDDLQIEEETTRDQLRSIQAQLADAPGTTQASLEEERDALQAQLRWVAARRVELDSVQAFMRRGDIIQPALVPQEPVSPKPLRTGVLALVLGSLLGVGLAFARHWMDDRLSSRADVIRAVGRPPLAVLDFTLGSRHVAESIRVLRASLATFLQRHSSLSGTASGASPAARVIQVASATKDADAAALVAHLARSFQNAGHAVIIVDLFSASEGSDPTATAGLSHYLHGQLQVADLLAMTHSAPVDLLVGGGEDVNELLASPRMTALLSELRHRYDIVLIAAPPVTMSAAPLDMGVQSDATVLTISMDRTRRFQLEDALERLRQVQVPIAGVVAVAGKPSASGSVATRSVSSSYNSETAPLS